MNFITSILARTWRFYKKFGFRKLLGRIVTEFRPRQPVKLKYPPFFPGAINDVRPENIHTHLDTPSHRMEIEKSVLVSGWTCAPQGIRCIDIFLDGQLKKQIQPNVYRPDVQSCFPNISDADNSGFSLELDTSNLQPGQHEILITVHDKKGNRRSFGLEIYRVENDTLYHRHFIASIASTYELDEIHALFDAHKPLPPVKLWIICQGLTDQKQLQKTLASVAHQDYPAFSCTVQLDAAVADTAQQYLQTVTPSQIDKFHFVHSASITDITGSTSHYSGVLQPGEILTPHALSLFACHLIEHSETDILYSDHDLYRSTGIHFDPAFKPDWSPDYLLAKNYIDGFYLFKTSRKPTFDTDIGNPAWRYDLLLALSSHTSHIDHVPRVLWSRFEKVNTDDRAEYEKHIVERYLQSEGIIVSVENNGTAGLRRIHWPTGNSPKVSIIIPTTGKMDYVKPCVESITTHTDYNNYELVFIDNSRGDHPDGIAYLKDRNIRVIERHEPFNWARLNNVGARESDGELLLFLNDDIEAVEPGWLEELVGQALRPKIGSVGAMLLYPDHTIQHGGIFLVDHGGGARHYFQGLNVEDEIYQGLHKVAREVTANTGACLMMRREVFEELGGFDEDLSVVGNDLDMCMRLIKRRYRNIWTPHCCLIHHESVSRKHINISDDEQRMWQRWEKHFLDGDPYYNPNLAQDRTDFSLRQGVSPSFPEQVKLTNTPGVNLIGYIRAEMGVGEAARSMANALQQSGVPFVILNYEYGNPSRQADTRWDHKITEQPEYDINILLINADLTPEACDRLPKNLFENRYTIGVWAWELPEFPDKWSSSFNYVDEIWGISEFVQHAVMKKSPVPVMSMPLAVEKEDIPYLEREYFSLPDESFLFLSMYDVYSIQQRKNPHGSIKAFQKAFAPDDTSVGLVIKVNNITPDEKKSLQKLTGDYRNIYILGEVMSRYETDSLTSVCDCFVSLHRSEGFGFGIAEAMSLGKVVIATNWSGNTDFMNENNAVCIDYELIRITSDLGPYKRGQYWAEPDIEQASQWMRKLATCPEDALKIGRRAKQSIAEQLAPKVIGNMIARRLVEIHCSRNDY